MVRVTSFFLFVFIACNALAQQEYFVPAAMPNNAEYGGGISLVDLNDDGRDDVVFAPEMGYVYAYINEYPTWQRISLFEMPGVSKQCLFADYDNDGDQDVAISYFNHPLELYRNDGSFQFTNVSNQIDPSVNFIQSIFGITWGDIDSDGWLDLYCSSYSYHPEAYSFLLHNDQGSFFSDYSYLYALPSTGRLVTQSLIVDLNDDSIQDIWEANDRSPQDRIFIQNNGSWFQYSPEAAGVTNLCAMSLSPNDFDHDGDLDVYISNDPVGNRMFVQSDQNTPFCEVCPSFSEQANQLGLSVNKMCWGATWIDWNNDMQDDLFVSTSETLPVETADELLIKTPEGFQSVMLDWLHDIPKKTYSAARGDLNGDHKEDLVLSHAGNSENEMIFNDNVGGNWLSVRLTGVQSNRDAIGAKISVFVGGTNYSKWLMCGQDYLSQHSRNLIFQLGTFERVDSIFIRWPNGLMEYIFNTPANTELDLVEGQASKFYWPFSQVEICPNDSLFQPISLATAFYWNDNETASSFYTPSESGPVNGRFLFQNQWIYTDTISIHLLEIPEVVIAESTPLCFGENNGMLSLVNANDEQWNQIYWLENGLPVLSNLASGEYLFWLETTDGCGSSGTYFLSEPSPLNCEVFTQDSMFTFSANGGVGEYDFFINGLALQQDYLFGPEEGDYLFEVRDENGCTCQSDFTVDYPSNIEESIAPFWMYEKHSKWRINDGASFCALYDLEGKIILPWALRSVVELSNLPDEIFLLRFQTYSGNFSAQRIYR